MDAYRPGIADAELPSETGVARSVIPPGTAATRDFSGLAPRIPEFVLEACVGCMTCVNACPDTAILGIAQPEPGRRLVDRGVRGHGEPDPAAAADGLRAHFAHTHEVRRRPGPSRPRAGDVRDLRGSRPLQGLRRVRRGLRALGYDALRDDRQASRRAAARENARALRARHALLPVAAADAAEYRNEKALADLMLGEHAFGYVGGAGSCSGCGEATAIRMLVAATRQVHGAGIDGRSSRPRAATPSSAARTRTTRTWCRGRTRCSRTRRPTPSGSGRAGTRMGMPDRRLWVIGGDGAMYDIGFQALSRMVASGADIKVLVLDTQVYSNTGGQASTASFGGQVTKLSAFGKEIHGRPERRKELGRILDGARQRLRRPDDACPHQPLLPGGHGGERLPRAGGRDRLHAVQPEHGIADDAARAGQAGGRIAGVPAVHLRPAAGRGDRRALSLQGNPALREDWATVPDGTRSTSSPSPGRRGGSPALRADGEPTPEILATQAIGSRTGTPSRSSPACADKPTR